MSNHKRTFCELQEVDGQSLDYPFTSKKLKIQSDHPLKLYVRLRPTPSDPKSANTGDASNIYILDLSLTPHCRSLNYQFGGKHHFRVPTWKSGRKE